MLYNSIPTYCYIIIKLYYVCTRTIGAGLSKSQGRNNEYRNCCVAFKLRRRRRVKMFLRVCGIVLALPFNDYNIPCFLYLTHTVRKVQTCARARARDDPSELHFA